MPRRLWISAGIVLQLLGWAVATALHQPLAMLLLPAGVAVIFALVPKLRRLWWPRRSRKTTTPVRWHVTMAAVCGLAVFSQISRLPASSTPPELVSADLWYNSALAHELSRTLRPQDPFVLGEPLRYHWFADAHVTATAQLSGVLIVDAIRFFWLIPMIVVVLLAVAAAAQQFMSGPRLRNAAGVALSEPVVVGRAAGRLVHLGGGRRLAAGRSRTRPNQQRLHFQQSVSHPGSGSHPRPRRTGDRSAPRALPLGDLGDPAPAVRPAGSAPSPACCRWSRSGPLQ